MFGDLLCPCVSRSQKEEVLQDKVGKEEKKRLPSGNSPKTQKNPTPVSVRELFAAQKTR